ncbi:Rieske 2Fe-2S domain-containing protein [Corallococcus sp. c25j21]|nr:Rieske 2Fe-2S domain-containing protein [Corallococcus silvisoli]
MNLLEVGGRRFFLLRSSDELLLVASACPHRGGPLHLGTWDSQAGAIQCPWHSRRITLKHLRKGAIPLVSLRDEVVAVFPDEPGALVRLRWRGILANEPAPTGACPSPCDPHRKPSHAPTVQG